MSATKCSQEHLQEYINGINEYLTKNNIHDFSKYNVSLKDSTLHFDKWEYSLPKPVDLKGISKPNNYTTVETRVMIIDIKTSSPLLYINSAGHTVSYNPTGERIEEVLRGDYFDNTTKLWKWNEFPTMKVKNGLIEYSNTEVKKIKIITIVSKNAPVVKTLYTFPTL